MEAEKEEANYQRMMALKAQDKKFADLCDVLDTRLHQAYMYTFGRWSRASFQEKAASTTAGWEIAREYGKDMLDAFVSDWYDTDIPAFDKPDEDRPPSKKRVRAEDVLDDQEERDAKRWRVDPTTITAREVGHQLLKCRRCRHVLTDRDACYILSTPDDYYKEEMVCLECWLRYDKEHHCTLCGKAGLMCPVYHPELSATRYLCYECDVKTQPPKVVHLKRLKTGEVVQSCDVYIGRDCYRGGWKLPGSVWYNPHTLAKGEKDTKQARQRLLDQYEAHVRGSPQLMARLPELAGKRLGCWCKPKQCHGDVLVKLWKETCQK